MRPVTISAACSRVFPTFDCDGGATVAPPCDLGFSCFEVNRDASCRPAASSTSRAFSSAVRSACMAKAFYRRSVVHKIVAMVLRKTKEPDGVKRGGFYRRPRFSGIFYAPAICIDQIGANPMRRSGSVNLRKEAPLVKCRAAQVIPTEGSAEPNGGRNPAALEDFSLRSK